MIFLISALICFPAFSETTNPTTGTPPLSAPAPGEECPEHPPRDVVAHVRTAGICSPTVLASGTLALNVASPTAASALARSAVGRLGGRMIAGVNIVGFGLTALQVLKMLGAGTASIERCRVEENVLKKHAFIEVQERGQRAIQALEEAGFVVDDRDVRRLSVDPSRYSDQRIERMLCGEAVLEADQLAGQQVTAFLEIIDRNQRQREVRNREGELVRSPHFGTLNQVEMPEIEAREITPEQQQELNAYAEAIRCLPLHAYAEGVCTMGNFIVLGLQLRFPGGHQEAAERFRNLVNRQRTPPPRGTPNASLPIHKRIIWGQRQIPDNVRQRIMRQNRAIQVALARANGQNTAALANTYASRDVIPNGGIVHVLGPSNSVDDWAIPLLARRDLRLILTEEPLQVRALGEALSDPTRLAQIYRELRRAHPQLVNNSGINTPEAFIREVRTRVALNAGFENRTFTSDPGVIRGWVTGDQIPQAHFIYANQPLLTVPNAAIPGAVSREIVNVPGGGQGIVNSMFTRQLRSDGIVLVNTETPNLQALRPMDRLGIELRSAPHLQVDGNLVGTGSVNSVTIPGMPGAGTPYLGNPTGFFLFPN